MDTIANPNLFELTNDHTTVYSWFIRGHAWGNFPGSVDRRDGMRNEIIDQHIEGIRAALVFSESLQLPELVQNIMPGRYSKFFDIISFIKGVQQSLGYYSRLIEEDNSEGSLFTEHQLQGLHVIVEKMGVLYLRVVEGANSIFYNYDNALLNMTEGLWSLAHNFDDHLQLESFAKWKAFCDVYLLGFEGKSRELKLRLPQLETNREYYQQLIQALVVAIQALLTNKPQYYESDRYNPTVLDYFFATFEEMLPILQKHFPQEIVKEG